MLLLAALVFTGSNWIATGYCPTASDLFECEVTVDAAQPGASAAVFGTVRELEPERSFAFYVRQDGVDSSVVAYGGAARGGFFPRGEKVSLSVGPDGATWTWNGGSDRLPLTPGFARDGVTPLMIGDVNAASLVGDSVPAGMGAVMTLHRFRIWRGGLELVHDYEPCRNGAGEEGLYDTVSGDFLPIKGGMTPEPEQPVITSIEVDQANDVVRVSVATKPGVTYALLRSPTVTPRSAYMSIGVEAVATTDTLTLTDADKDRSKSQAFYIVEAR